MKFPHQLTRIISYSKNDFLKRMDRINKQSLTWKYSLIGSGTSLAICLLWNTYPYGQIYSHFTISEYVNQYHYYHAILLSPLSFQTYVSITKIIIQQENYLTYFPLMFSSLYLCSKHMRGPHMAIFYITNSIIATGITFWYERKKNSQLGIKMISPKCIGAITPLGFSSVFIAISPNFTLFNNVRNDKFLAYFLIPALYYMFEIEQFRNNYVTEICRPSHLGSIIWGLLFGLIFKRFGM